MRWPWLCIVLACWSGLAAGSVTRPAESSTETVSATVAVDELIDGLKFAQAAQQLRIHINRLPAHAFGRSDQEMLLICEACSDGRFEDAVKELSKHIASAKDHGRIAATYNTLGGCYRAQKKPKDALHNYLMVDLVYNQDQAQHLRALRQLRDLFFLLQRPDLAKEYSAKLDRLRK
jgi:hypothetical protein